MRLRKSKRNRARNYRNPLIVVGLLAIYGLYVAYGPGNAQVAKIEADRSSATTLQVFVSNPTMKFISGELVSVTTEEDLFNPETGGHTTLQSLPRTYDFFLLPLQTQRLDIRMNGLVKPAVDYDITLITVLGGQAAYTLQPTNSTG